MGPSEAGKTTVSGLRRSSGPAATGAAKPRGAGAGRAGPRSRRDRQARDSGGGELGEGRLSFGEVVGEEAGLPLVVLDDVVAHQVAQEPGADDLQQVRDGNVGDARQGVEHRFAIGGPRHEGSIQHDGMKMGMKFQVGGNPLYDGHGTTLAVGCAFDCHAAGPFNGLLDGSNADTGHLRSHLVWRFRAARCCFPNGRFAPTCPP